MLWIVVTIFLFYQAIHILITNISAVAVYYMQIHAVAIIASVVFQLQLTTKETYFNKLKHSEWVCVALSDACSDVVFERRY